MGCMTQDRNATINMTRAASRMHFAGKTDFDCTAGGLEKRFDAVPGGALSKMRSIATGDFRTSVPVASPVETVQPMNSIGSSAQRNCILFAEIFI